MRPSHLLLAPLPPELAVYRFWATLFAQPKLAQVWLFGSRARGRHHERADIDLALACPGADIHEWTQILDQLAQADTLLRIDALRLEDLPEGAAIRKEILTKGLLVFSRA